VTFSAPTTFATTYTNAVYILNGTPIALTGSLVNFDTTRSFGFCFDAPGNYGMSSLGGTPQVFSGATASPTLVVGSYNQTGTLNVRDALQDINSTSTASALSITSAVSPTPLPSSLLLISLGIALVAAALAGRELLA
jgi:hypothetical protein